MKHRYLSPLKLRKSRRSSKQIRSKPIKLFSNKLKDPLTRREMQL